MKKLILRDDLKNDLKKMLEILEEVKIPKAGLSSINGSGVCTYCEQFCSASCKGVDKYDINDDTSPDR